MKKVFNDYYTYAFLREDKTPYYIGKGRGDRIYCKRGRAVSAPKDKSRFIFLKQNLTEEEAFRHEIYMIDLYGRKDLGTGILHNLTDGGEGVSGYTHTEETLKQMSEVKSGENHPFYNKKHTPEARKKMSKSLSGENNPNYGKTGEKCPNYGRKHTPEELKKLSEAMSGENNPMYNKKRTPEERKKMSEAMKKYWENKKLQSNKI